MKKIIPAIIVASAIMASCTKIVQLANINVDIPYNQQVTVPPVTGYGSQVALPNGGINLDFPSVAFATNSQQYISQYKTAANMIVDVDLQSLALQIQAPAGQTFDFLDNVQVYISSKTQPEMLIASQSSIPKGQTTLNLVTDPTVNLKDYFVEDTIYFRLSSHINAVPLSGAQLNIASVFHMLANPLE